VSSKKAVAAVRIRMTSERKAIALIDRADGADRAELKRRGNGVDVTLECDIVIMDFNKALDVRRMCQGLKEDLGLC
jgi:hypothetical protein